MRAAGAEGRNFVCGKYGWKFDGNYFPIGVGVYCRAWNCCLFSRCGGAAGYLWNGRVLCKGERMGLKECGERIFGYYGEEWVLN